MGKVLQLPHAEEVPIYYSCLLIELCKCHPTVYPLIVSGRASSICAHHMMTILVVTGNQDVV